MAKCNKCGKCSACKVKKVALKRNGTLKKGYKYVKGGKIVKAGPTVKRVCSRSGRTLALNPNPNSASILGSKVCKRKTKK